MNDFMTIVVRMPKDEAGKDAVKQALKLLEPHQTAMSLEDEMTILETIEQHPDFNDQIGVEARAEAKRLHAVYEASNHG